MDTETVAPQRIVDAIAVDSVQYLPSDAVRASTVITCFLSGSSSSVPLTTSGAIDPKVLLLLQFDWLSRKWRRDTRFTSSLTKMVLHPAYQAIIGMGKEVLPLIFSDLRRSRDHWLWALHAITQTDPAPQGADFSTAVDAWIQWGRDHGYLAD